MSDTSAPFRATLVRRACINAIQAIQDERRKTLNTIIDSKMRMDKYAGWPRSNVEAALEEHETIIPRMYCVEAEQRLATIQDFATAVCSHDFPDLCMQVSIEDFQLLTPFLKG